MAFPGSRSARKELRENKKRDCDTWSDITRKKNCLEVHFILSTDKIIEKDLSLIDCRVKQKTKRNESIKENHSNK